MSITVIVQILQLAQKYLWKKFSK